MTKEITKAIILQEIQDKFKLREFLPAKFLFDETVVPVYDVQQHLVTWEVIDATVSITAGPSAYTFFTVPDGERWFMSGFNVIFITGAFTTTGCVIYRTQDDYFYLDMLAGVNTSYAHDLPKDITLNAGDLVRMYVDSYTSTGNLRLSLNVAKETIR